MKRPAGEGGGTGRTEERVGDGAFAPSLEGLLHERGGVPEGVEQQVGIVL